MLDLFIQYFICSLASFSILRLVFASAIFSYYRSWLFKYKTYACVEKQWVRYYLLYGLGCWQCFGYWCAAAVSVMSAVAFSTAYVGITNIPGLILLILCVGITTDVAGEFIPTTVADFSDDIALINEGAVDGTSGQPDGDGSELASELDTEEADVVRADVSSDNA